MSWKTMLRSSPKRSRVVVGSEKTTTLDDLVKLSVLRRRRKGQGSKQGRVWAFYWRVLEHQFTA